MSPFVSWCLSSWRAGGLYISYMLLNVCCQLRVRQRERAKVRMALEEKNVVHKWDVICIAVRMQLDKILEKFGYWYSCVYIYALHDKIDGLIWVFPLAALLRPLSNLCSFQNPCIYLDTYFHRKWYKASSSLRCKKMLQNIYDTNLVRDPQPLYFLSAG